MVWSKARKQEMRHIWEAPTEALAEVVAESGGPLHSAFQKELQDLAGKFPDFPTMADAPAEVRQAMPTETDRGSCDIVPHGARVGDPRGPYQMPAKGMVRSATAQPSNLPTKVALIRDCLGCGVFLAPSKLRPGSTVLANK